MPKGRPKNSTRPIPTREWLERKYLIEGWTTVQVAEAAGYSSGGMSLLLMRLGLTKGGKGASQRLSIDRDTLYQLHVVEGLTAVRIAARMGCNNGTISRYIKRWGLDPQRPLVNVRAVPPMTRDELWKAYWVDMQSLSAIGRRFGTTPTTVGRWMRQHDIPRRRWNGGGFTRTYVRGEGARRNGKNFSASQREAIFRRDGYRCQMPGCESTEHLEANHVLPVRYGGGYERHNGVTLCHQCHASILNREMDFKVLFDEIVRANTDRM